MNYRDRNKVIEAISKDNPLFIKGTGVQIKVDYFGTDMEDFRLRGRGQKQDKRLFCNIDFMTPPTNKVLKRLVKYHFKRNSHTNQMEISGVICIDELSTVPHNSRAGELLYGKGK